MSIEKLFGELYEEKPVTHGERSPAPVPRPRRWRMLPHFRLPKIPPKLILFTVIVFGVFYLMHLSYQSIPKKFPLEITSQKPLGKNTTVSYTASEKPQFIVKKPEINPLLAAIVRTVTIGSGDGIRVKLITPNRKEIAFRVNTSLAGSGKKRVTLIKKAFAAEGDTQGGGADISITSEKDGVGIGLPALGKISGLPRGRYVVDVTWEKDGITYNNVYAFSWGVLVMNTEKDRYQKGELVKAGIGMVDDRGYTICGGDVTATITSPTGKKVTLRTPRNGPPLRSPQATSAGQAKGSGMDLLTEEQAASLAFVTGGDSSYIAFSKDCADRSVTDNPDYSFQFTVPEKGRYTIDLSATTVNGTEKLTQQFEVVENNTFAIARSASMRIYPLEDYQMRISLMAKEGYIGKVVETVPHEFGIAECGGCKVSEKGDEKMLTWNVTLSPNVPQTLIYTYNPPDISPALFFTGPLVAGERREQRRWAIAFDAVVPQVTLTQRHYIFEDDDGANVNSNTDIAAADTAITDVRPGERINARFQIDNTSANTFFNPQFEIFYDRNDNIWTRVEASGSAAVVPGTGNCVDTNWDCGIADNESAIEGVYTDIAVDPSGKVWVSYRDGNADLRVATYVGSGGSGCGVAVAWSCSTIDSSAASPGRYTSIAFDASGSAWISHQDFGNGDLKVSNFVGSGGSCTNSAWNCTIVDSSATNIGDYTSIAFDASGNAWISYKDVTNGDLKVATYVGSGGNCTSAAWNCTVVDSLVTSTGNYTSIAFDASGNAWVSYQASTFSDLKVANYVGSGGNCSDTAWNCTVVDDTAVGSYTSIAFDPSGNAWVSYKGDTNAPLEVATYVGSGGNCTSAAWSCTTIDNSAAIVGSFSSIAFDKSGRAWVSYQDGTNGALKVANYVGSGGNCTSAAWNCTIVDSLAVGTGLWTSIAFDAAGNAWVSYTDNGNGDLRVANIKRGGEIIPGYGLSGEPGDRLTAAAAGSCTGGTSFVTGFWSEGVYIASSSAALGNMASNKCTEVSFMIDTSRAIAGTTYRLRLKNASPGYNIGLNTYSQSPTLTIASSNTFVSSKDNQYALSNCTDTTWGCGTVNSNATLAMRDNSMVFDASGSAWISSADNWIGDLWVSRYVGSNGGGCGSSGGNAWKCTKLDHGANQIGLNNAIGINPAGKAYISYYESTASNLKVAEYVGSGGSGCGASPTPTDWTCYTVKQSFGGNTSIAFDASGNPWISGFTDALFLGLARYVGSGGTGCAISSWMCYYVDTNTNFGRYSAIKFDQNKIPWISYTDQVANAIRIAKYVGAGGGSALGCGANSSTEWRCETIDDQGDSLGQNATGLVIDNNNAPWVAYYDLTVGDLWVAKYVGSGGSGCTSSTYSGKWSCTKVEGTNDVGKYLSIALGPDGKPWISYQDVSNTSLRVARYVGGGTGTGCGGGSSDWTCATVDNQLTTTGGYTSIAFDPSGVPWVAESEVDGGVANDLRIAKLHYPYFDNQIRYSLDSLGYTYVTSDDTNFDQMAVTTNTPIYRASERFSSTAEMPSVQWIGKSNVAASTNNILLQVYRYGSTNAWETVTTNSSCTADTDCTVTGTPSGTASEYWEADGSNYWIHFRVYQVAGTSKTLQTDLLDAVLPPTKIVFSTGQRSVNSGVCSGASVPFTLQLQSAAGSALAPSGTTVVQVTSDSSSYAIYSDSSCSTAISGGNITFTTSDTSKTFYLIDSVRGSHVLTATKTSGPDTLTAGTQYQITNTAGGDTDSTAIIGGVNLRGGSTIR